MENNSNRNYGQDDRNSQDQQTQKWANSNEENNDARKAADRENTTQRSPERSSESSGSLESGTNPDRYATSTQRDDNESDDVDTDSESDRADYSDTDNPGMKHPEE